MKTPVVNHEPTLLVPGLPALCAALLLAAQPAAATVSYDTDGDGLIEISSLAQLNAIRWDLDGDGAEVNGADVNGADVAYAAAFPDAAAGMGCPTNSDDSDDSDCTGYELTADLDFDTDGDGDVDADRRILAQRRGLGSYRGLLSHVRGQWAHHRQPVHQSFLWCHRLVRERQRRRAGAECGGSRRGRDGLGRELGCRWAGGAQLRQHFVSSNVTGSVTSSVSGNYGSVSAGGLVGNNGRSRQQHRQHRRQLCDHYAVTALGKNSQSAGGLVGFNGGSGSSSGSIVASYATGAVTGSGNNSDVGGLVGFNGGSGRQQRQHRRQLCDRCGDGLGQQQRCRWAGGVQWRLRLAAEAASSPAMRPVR